MGLAVHPVAVDVSEENVPLGTQNFTIKDEKELHLIKSKLEYNREEKRWIAEYSWIQNPAELPDNKMAAMGMLISTEKRLAKNEEHAKVY